MFCHGLAHLRGGQMSLTAPLNLHSCPGAIAFNLGTTICLEHFSPGKIECVVIVANVHHLFANEFFSDFGVDLRKYFTAVGEGCFPSLTGGLNTKKADRHRPLP